VPAVSQHLSKLRLAGVCEARRDGQRVWYELVDLGVRDLVRQLLDPAPSGTLAFSSPATARRS
jgi:DNA-binding transcriptional ArsR family regulator